MSTISANNSFPVIKVVVNIPNSTMTVTNTADAHGGGDPNHANAGTAATGSDTVTPVMPVAPRFMKTFGSNMINQGDTVPVTFMISNTNPIPLTGLAFTDTLPSGLALQSPNGQSNTCGGTSAMPGSGIISITGGTVAASSTCTITVNLVGQAPGDQTNPSITLTSNEAPAGSSMAVTVYVDPWWLWFFYAQ